MIDFSDVTAFATKLSSSAERIDTEAEKWAAQWGAETVKELVATVPRASGKLASSIQQVEPGGIEIGADYWRFVDRGTSRMAPQPFVAPSLNRVQPRAVEDAKRAATQAITR